MYSVYDFINATVESKQMKLGWKIETSSGKIILKYTMLNFDWSSLDYLGYDTMDMFLSSKLYASYRKKMSNAMKKFGRLYIDATSISELKTLAEYFKVEVDIDKIIRKTIEKKSEKMKSKRDVERAA